MKILFIVISILSYTLTPNLTYEGRLYTVDGKVYTGQADMTFRLYSQSEGGTPIWEESASVEVKDGFFTVILGKQNPLPEPLPSTLFLSVDVNSSGEMTPRLEITPAPYSLLSEKALSTSRKFLHKSLTSLIILEWCVEDPTTCCNQPNEINYTLENSTLTGEIGGSVLLTFSALLQADGTGNPDEERSYNFHLYMDGTRVYSTTRTTIPKSPWGMSSLAITYLLPNVSQGNHTFEVRYCPMNSNVTGGTRLWQYNFDVIQLP